VRRNLQLHARLFRLSQTEGDARIAALAERFDLGPVMDALPDALPLGIRQRLQLAVAVLHRPDVLILDEPTAGLDAASEADLLALIRTLHEGEGKTVLWVHHRLEQCSALARQVCRVDQQRVWLADATEGAS
jgi:ribosome-dependent ATPase